MWCVFFSISKEAIIYKTGVPASLLGDVVCNWNKQIHKQHYWMTYSSFFIIIILSRGIIITTIRINEFLIAVVCN